ncbi:AAA family ATPase [Phyllobacterium lublinensis]|uniref:AAA family ATPase n=1 Tax=Phyllobacterium lublinensis TaxID=2875708 RepID=UPI001CCC8BF8|nr:AAA family ATPase [Phyllobacterium sp. 2063]MBZ9656913.1 AAA family ATPase [Phyllobacterium sp. 2063]
MFRYLIARLRHEAWRRSIRVAVDAGFVGEVERSVEGFTTRMFHSCTAIPDGRMRNFESILRRLNVNRNKSTATAGFDDDELPDGEAWSGRWEEPDPGSRKLTGYRPGSKSPRDDTADMSTVVKRNTSRPIGENFARENSILQRIRAAGRLLSPVDVATILLVTKAVERSGGASTELSARLSEPGLVVSVFGGVEGFEASFMSLLKRGIFGPPSVALVDGTTIGKSGSFVYPNRTAVSRRVITFVGSETNAQYADLADWQLGKAAELGVPVLGVTEGTALLPERMLPASSLSLITGPLTYCIVGDTIALVLGAAAQDTLDDRCCSLLTLTDLALAIRPGTAPDLAISILRELALSRTGDRSAKSGGSGTPGAAQVPKTLASGGRYRKPIHSGSEIIQPQQIAGAKNTVPSIETLAGYGEAKIWAMNLKVDLDLWTAGKTPWADLSSKILLCGPPGTGKTLFAKALTNSLGIPLYVTSVGIWLEAGHLEDVLGRMHAVFAEAQAASPCVLFIDEIDGVGRRRSAVSGSSDLWNNVVTRLLELLDGAVKFTGVVVVGATNNRELIDPALLRSGRLEKQITIALPDVDALTEIIRFHIAGDLTAEADDSCDAETRLKCQTPEPDKSAIRRLAGLAIGKTGADIERVVREARQAARRDQRPFTIADVEANLGEDKPAKTAAILQLSAIHEAGHAIACLAFGRKIIEMITINDSQGRSYTETSDAIDDGSAQALCDGIVTWLAGRAAEEVLLGGVSRGSGGSGESDLAKATEMACMLETSYGCNSQHPLLYLGSIEPFSLLAGRQDIAFAVNERLEACYAIAKDLIGRNLYAVKGLADMLLKHETLEGPILSKTLEGLVIS